MRAFAPGWKLSAFTILMLPLLVGLGWWQLNREAQQQELLVRQNDKQAAAPVPATGPRSARPADFSRLRLTGRYVPHRYLLLDNQIDDGRVGYWVIHLFVDDQARSWWINRGWVAAPIAREQLPRVPAVPGNRSVIAVVWPDTGQLPLVGPDPWVSGWPKRIQRVDHARLQQWVVAADLDLRLEAGSPGALVPPNRSLGMSPARHRGYALQWFGLAAILAAGYVIVGFRPSSEQQG